MKINLLAILFIISTVSSCNNNIKNNNSKYFKIINNSNTITYDAYQTGCKNSNLYKNHKNYFKNVFVAFLRNGFILFHCAINYDKKYYLQTID